MSRWGCLKWCCNPPWRAWRFAPPRLWCSPIHKSSTPRCASGSKCRLEGPPPPERGLFVCTASWKNLNGSVEPKVWLQGYAYSLFGSHSSRCLEVVLWQCFEEVFCAPKVRLKRYGFRGVPSHHSHCCGPGALVPQHSGDRPTQGELNLQGDGTKVTESAQNADFRMKPQIFADSPLLLEIQAFGGRRFSQKTADFRRKRRFFAENRRKPQIGLRHLRSVTLSSALPTGAHKRVLKSQLSG